MNNACVMIWFISNINYYTENKFIINHRFYFFLSSCPLIQHLTNAECNLILSGLEEDARTDKEEETKVEDSGSESDHSEEEEEKEEVFDDDLQPIETPYTENHTEELGQVRGLVVWSWGLSLVKNILNCANS